MFIYKQKVTPPFNNVMFNWVTPFSPRPINTECAANMLHRLILSCTLYVPIIVFSPGEGGITSGLDSQNSHCPREFDRRLWHRGGTLDASARKSQRVLCLNLKACPWDFWHEITKNKIAFWDSKLVIFGLCFQNLIFGTCSNVGLSPNIGKRKIN